MANEMLDLMEGFVAVDLSVLNSPDLPCWWPGGSPYEVEVVSQYDNPDDPDYSRNLMMNEHTGTHFDAPAHYVPDPDSGLPHSTPAGKTTSDKVPLGQFMGPSAVIDVAFLLDQGEPGVSPLVGMDDIKQWEETHGGLQRGEVVLFRTGWSEKYYLPFPEGSKYAADPVLEKSSPGWPAPSPETVAYLVDRGIQAMGSDGGSAGPLPSALEQEVHFVGLGAGMIFFERLAHLDRLPARGGFFIFLPVHCEGGSGGPGRAIGLVPRKWAEDR